MNPDHVNLGLLIVAILGAGGITVWVKWGVHFFRGLNRLFENINGRPAEYDRSGTQIRDAVPSLQAQVADIKTVVSDQAQQNTRLSALETTVAEHGTRLAQIEEGHQVERIVGRVESAQAFKTMEAIANSTSSPLDKLQPDDN